VWEFRKGLTNGVFAQLPWFNTYGSYLQDKENPNVLYATMTTFVRYPTMTGIGPPGTLFQIGRWTATFNDDGKIKKMHQDILYGAFLNASDPVQADPCSATPKPATICASESP
jgi:hypothetical protein